MGQFVVLGAGAIGRGTAAELAGDGHAVTLVSRSGARSPIAGVNAVSADVRDADRLTELCAGAQAVVNAVNPPRYDQWPQLWPPMAQAMLEAARRSGAGLVTVNNLYLYGAVDGPIREDAPIAPRGPKGRVRAQMWQDALAAHEAGEVRAVELRGSDYVGPGMGAQSLLGSFVIRPAMQGRAGWLVMGDLDAPHTWTAGRDVARLAARLATEPAGSDAWGRAWHVPSAPARSMAQVAQDTAALVGSRARRPHRLPTALVDVLGLAAPILRELKETRHEFDNPWVLDSSAAQERFGLAPTPWEVTLKETVDQLSGTAA